MALRTTKSLPAPCILVNLSFMVSWCQSDSGVGRRRAGWAGLETFVGPEIFGRRLAHALFNKSVHAAGGGQHVVARVIVPCRIKFYFPTLVIGQESGDHGDDGGAGGGGDSRRRGQGGGRDAKKRHEGGVLVAEVHVRQHKVGQAVAQGAHDGLDAILAGKQAHGRKARAALAQHFVEHLVFCATYIELAEATIATATPATSRQTKWGHSRTTGPAAICSNGTAGVTLIRRWRRLTGAHHRMARSKMLRVYAWKCWRANSTRAASVNSGMHSRRLIRAMRRRERSSRNRTLPTPLAKRPSTGRGSQCSSHMKASTSLIRPPARAPPRRRAACSGCSSNNIARGKGQSIVPWPG